MATPVHVTSLNPVRWLLLAIAVILFVLAAFGVSFGGVNLVDLGLAFGFGAFLVPGAWW